MRLSVIVPVYNEKSTVVTLLNRVRNTDIEKEIIVVDDCSTDGTREVLEKAKGIIDKIIYHEKNRGKGAAIRTGLRRITGDVVIIQDADLEYDPQEYLRLIKPIIEDRADVVYGSRFSGGRRLFSWHYVGNKFLTLLSNMFTGLNLTDMETCYKMFKRDVIQNIEIEQNGFDFEPEITAKVARKKCRIYEIGISYSGRNYHEGKKIGWKDGLQAIWCIIKYGLKRDLVV